MGFRYRKSINLGGGFKINLSKSGIGYSWGTKGYRITKTSRGTTRRTYSIPGTGISYVDETGRRKQNKNQGIGNSQNSIVQQSYIPNAEHIIESSDISQFKEAEQGTITDSIEKTIKLNWVGTVLLWGLLLIPANPLFIIVPIVGAILKIVAHTAGRVTLNYSFDPEKEEEHIRRIDAWQLLVDGKKEWQVLSEQFNNNRKVNAGAGRSIKRVLCRVAKGHPFYINTNVDTVQIVLHKKERLIILPDKVFFIRKRKVGLIDYSDFQIIVSSVRFVESGPVPSDAQIVDRTWQFVNKNGTPDRRYNNNRQLPICLYGQVFLRSSSGLNVELQISSIQNTRDFAELIK